MEMIRQSESLKDHVAVVAGGSGGIGMCVCKALRQLGATVVSVHRRSRHSGAAADGIVELRADLRSFNEWTRLVGIIMERFGAIDSLINCSGVLIPGTVLSLSESQIRAMVEVNILSFMYGCRAVLPVMRRQKRGHIITVGSLGGVLPMPFEPVYCATKFALRGFALSVNEEVRGTGIRCSVVSSGPVTTSMLDEEAHDPNSVIAFMTKPMTPEAVTGTILELLSHPRPEVMVPRAAGMSSRLLAFTPRLFGLMFRLLTPYGQWRQKRYINDRAILSNP